MMLSRFFALCAVIFFHPACTTAAAGHGAVAADSTSDSAAEVSGGEDAFLDAAGDSVGDLGASSDADSLADTASSDVAAIPTKTAIAGTAHGKAFTTAASAWLIGKPDTLTDTVVYLFSEKVDCDQITTAGWDGTLADGTQMLEIKMIGSDLAVYPVVATATPAPGEASVNTTLVSAGQPTEGAAKSGTVTLAAFAAGASAAGSFDLKFAGGEALSGTFAVTYCAAGREP